jgi:hypothetical protein
MPLPGIDSKVACSQVLFSTDRWTWRTTYQEDWVNQTQNYGALPRTQKERASLARTLNKFVTVRFPEYAARRTHAAIIGVPGFWQDETGNVQLWNLVTTTCHCSSSPTATTKAESKPANSGFTETIFALGEKKYRWLACPFPFRGASSGTPIHFTFKPADLPPGKTVIITEGALKADVLVSLRPKARVIATSGVSCSHAEIIEAAALQRLIAFDADYKTNPAVARQLARLIAAREQDIAARNLKTSTRIVTWQRYKGIDDAVLASASLETMTILRMDFNARRKTAPGSPGSLGTDGLHAYISQLETNRSVEQRRKRPAQLRCAEGTTAPVGQVWTQRRPTTSVCDRTCELAERAGKIL